MIENQACPPSHARPPPEFLHAPSSWPDGTDPRPSHVDSYDAAPCRSIELSDEQLAIIEALTTGAATPEQRAAAPAALESLRARRSSPYRAA